jgi:hypothetical protein
VRIRFGFRYEQADVQDVSRMRGLYVWDEDTGAVLMSEDVEPTEETQRLIERVNEEK